MLLKYFISDAKLIHFLNLTRISFDKSDKKCNSSLFLHLNMDEKTRVKYERIEKQFARFVPAGFEKMLCDLLFAYPVNFKIVAPRSTKLGDFRAGLHGKKHQITVNGDLNPYSFLITSLHEFAHLTCFEKNGHRVAPHGEEWKHEYRKLLVPAIDTKLLPKDIENALVKSLTNTKASSCSDMQLNRTLSSYDKKPEGIEILEHLPKNTTFALQGRIFQKGELRRSRFLCEEKHSKKNYLIHALSHVKRMDE